VQTSTSNPPDRQHAAKLPVENDSCLHSGVQHSARFKSHPLVTPMASPPSSCECDVMRRPEQLLGPVGWVRSSYAAVLVLFAMVTCQLGQDVSPLPLKNWSTLESYSFPVISQ
jgi:hypothetical protein